MSEIIISDIKEVHYIAKLVDNIPEININNSANFPSFSGTVKVIKEGDIYWKKENKLHRLDGPAIEHVNGNHQWYLNGKRHRLDGPAVSFFNTQEWWVNGRRVSEKNFSKEVKKYLLRVE